MYLQEVLSELEKKYDIHLSQSTLRNYQNERLIPRTSRMSLGRGKGTTTEYPGHAIYEIYAAYMLMNSEVMVKPELIAKARSLVLDIENGSDHAPKRIDDMLEVIVCELWLYYRELAKNETSTIVRLVQDDSGIQIEYINTNEVGNLSSYKLR